jgi:LmbE family N-acetylglucosaminyl deacetylase
MINLCLPRDGRPLHILCLGAHADDIEIGCGGTISRLIAERPDTTIRWVVFSGSEVRQAEAHGSAAAFFYGMNADYQLCVHDFRDGYFPFYGAAIKDAFESLKQDVEPSLIFTHSRGDAHQDHRLIAELTHCTFRNHCILEYEIPKFDGDLGNPNLFVPLKQSELRHKIKCILTNFPSQAGRQWFDDATFLALARLRGVGCNAAEGVAEAFYASKLVL